MARISISLPDELMARLEPVKERLNISQLCREALERRIAAFERATNHQTDELNLDALVHRLREERDLVEGKFENLARNSAAAWLETSSYFELKNLAEAEIPSNMYDYRLPQAAFRLMKRDMEGAKASCDGAYAAAYKTAWLDYVGVVWAEVVNKLEETNHTEPVEAVE